MTDVMYEIPSDPTITAVRITRRCVEERAQPELTYGSAGRRQAKAV